MYDFFGILLNQLDNILSLQLINGITLQSIFFANMIFISLWVVVTRR